MIERHRKVDLPPKYLWLHVVGTAIAAAGAYGLAAKYIEFVSTEGIEWLTPLVSTILLLIGIGFVVPSIIYVIRQNRVAERKDA